MIVPDDWNAIRIEGAWEKGHVLLADLKQPRLGLRWESLPDGRDAELAVRDAVNAEIGDADRKHVERITSADGVEDATWTHARLFLDPASDGRDLFIAHSRISGRIMQLTAPRGGGKRRLKSEIVPALHDTPADAPVAWSMLDLSCITPTGWSLARQQMSAGDLRLSFTDKGQRRLLVRQVAPARLALSRMPLRRWLEQHPLERQRGDTAGGIDESFTAMVCGREVSGVRQVWTRRGVWPARWFRRSPEAIEVCALHDPGRDRLWILEGNAPEALAGVIGSLDWSAEPDAGEGG